MKRFNGANYFPSYSSKTFPSHTIKTIFLQLEASYHYNLFFHTTFLINKYKEVGKQQIIKKT